MSSSRSSGTHGAVSAALKKKSNWRHITRGRAQVLRDYAALPFRQRNSAFATCNVNDLVYLVNRFKENKAVSHLAYNYIVGAADLNVIKKYADGVDLTYMVNGQLNAVFVACVYDRVDVLRWLIEDKGLSINSENENAEFPIDHARKNNSTKVLCWLYAPVAQGGLGLSKTTLDTLGFQMPMNAALAGDWQTFNLMLQPVQEGGLGWQLNATTLQNHPFDSNPSSPYLFVARHSQLTSDDRSTVVRVNTRDWSRTDFKIVGDLGKGSYGRVIRYQSGDESIAVKLAVEGWESFRRFQSRWQKIRREYDMLVSACPDDGPYALQQLRFYNRHERIVLFRSSLTMPVYNGLAFGKFVNHNRTQPTLIARAMLKAAEKVASFHDKGIVHCDLKSNNMLVGVSDNNVSVKIIDFGIARKVGEVVNAIADDKYHIYAPETRGIEQFYYADFPQDVWMLARTFETALVEHIAMQVIEKGEVMQGIRELRLADFYQAFPPVRLFLTLALLGDSSKRPSLHRFIDAMRKQLDLPNADVDESTRHASRPSLT